MKSRFGLQPGGNSGDVGIAGGKRAASSSPRQIL
jgi:hypothetical protein